MAEPVSGPSLRELTSWHSDWSTLRVVVVGLGATGFAIVDTLVERGATVMAVALDADNDVVRIMDVLGATSVMSHDAPERIHALEGFGPHLAVLSPGIREDDPVVGALRKRRVPLWSDVDFAWRVRDKSSAVSAWVLIAGDQTGVRIADLAQRMLHAGGVRALVTGFSATPLLDALRDPHDYDTLLVVATDTQVSRLARHEPGGRSPLMAVCVDSDVSFSGGALYDGVRLGCVYRKGPGGTMPLVIDADVVDGARAIGLGSDSPGMSDIGIVEGIVVDRAFIEDRENLALEITTLTELAEAGWAIATDLPVVLGAIAIARGHDVSPEVIAQVLNMPESPLSSELNGAP